YYDATGPLVEGTGDDPWLSHRHPDDRGHIPPVASPRHVTYLIPAHRSVLAFDPDSVKSELAQEVDQVGVRKVSADYGNRFAFGEFPFDLEVYHELRLHINRLQWLSGPLGELAHVDLGGITDCALATLLEGSPVNSRSIAWSACCAGSTSHDRHPPV